MERMKIWIDIANTAEIPFFRPIIHELIRKDYRVFLTCWNRGEVPRLLHALGFNAKPILNDSSNPLVKAISVGLRALILPFMTGKFDVLITMENVMPLLTSHSKQRLSVLILDNDVKLSAPKSIFQKMENKIKKLASYILVPEVAYENFSKFFGDNILTYPGYKEHISISDYTPDSKFLHNLPFEDYIVIRPESMASHYVLEKKSIVPELLRLFSKEGINIVYIPRNDAEKRLADNYMVYIPSMPLNGLDLSYYSTAVLTGSGTMAREATLLGVPSISFFPGEKLLAIDLDLIHKNMLFHSRDPQEIFEYVISNWGKRRKPQFKKAVKVRKDLMSTLYHIISQNQGNNRGAT